MDEAPDPLQGWGRWARRTNTTEVNRAVLRRCCGAAMESPNSPGEIRDGSPEDVALRWALKGGNAWQTLRNHF